MSGAASFPSHLATAERPRLGARPLCQFGPGPERGWGGHCCSILGPKGGKGAAALHPGPHSPFRAALWVSVTQRRFWFLSDS